MSEKERELNEILAAIESTAIVKKRINYLSVAIPLFLGLLLLGWSIYLGQDLRKISQQLEEKKQELKRLQDKYDSLQEDYDKLLYLRNTVRMSLDQDVMARNFVVAALDSLAIENYDGAIHEYDRALALNPGDHITLSRKGYAYLANGQIKHAISALERARSIDSSYVLTHYNLALAYFSDSKNELAISEVQKVIQLKPSFKEILKNDYLFKRFRNVPELQRLLE